VAAETLKKAFGWNEKTRIPLSVVIGASGQGKTEMLMWLLRDELPGGAIYQLLKNAFQAKHVVAVFATFNQKTTWTVEDEQHPVAALLSRLMCYSAKKEWCQSMTSAVADQQINFTNFTKKLRQLHGAAHGVGADEVVVLVLVDEIRKMDAKSRTFVLNCLCDGMQNDISQRLPTLVVASCLDVSSVFAVVTRGSQRPVLPLPVPPCPVGPEGLGTIERLFVDKLARNTLFRAPSVQKAIVSKFKHDLHATGGHYRAIERLWEHYSSDTNLQTCVPFLSFVSDFNFSVAVLRLVITGSNIVEESDELVGLDNKCATVGEIIHETTHGVFLQEIIRDTKKVKITLAPAALRFPTNSYGKHEHVVALLQRLTSIFTYASDTVKDVEEVLPLSELLHAHMWLQQRPGEGITAKELYGAGNFVYTPWSSEAGNQLVVQPLFRELQPLSSKRDDHGTVTTGHSLLRDAVARAQEEKGPVFAFPSVVNFPTIEGIVTNFIFGKHHVLQMKMWKDMAPSQAIAFLQDVHVKAQRLGAPAGSYLAVLYTTADVHVSATDLPEGSLVVQAGGLARLLAPLGNTPILQMLEEKKK
jgi:hypothetical protein